MNSSYINAAVGAFLAVAFVLMTVSLTSEAVFHSDEPEAEGFAIVVSEDTAVAEADESEDEGLVPIATLLASASVDEGMRAFRKCQACHTVDNGGGNRAGPNLWEIVDRPVAAATGFGYSTAMTDYAEGGAKSWDYEALNRFLHAPRGYVSGTSMGFAGLKRDDERANVIAYLRSLSDNPPPLPSPDAGDEGAEAEPASMETDGDTASGDATNAESETDAAADEGAEQSQDGETAADDGAGEPADTSTE